MAFHSGFVAIVGRPNVGKSTLLNTLIGQKIAIMSDKPQTTRNRIQGVLTRESEQIVFLDTPGIHKPKHRLGDYMVRVAEHTLQEVDVILFVVDVTEKFDDRDQHIIELLRRVQTPTFLVVNKIDAVSPAQILPVIESYRHHLTFQEVLPISARAKDNTDTLVDLLVPLLPEGPKYYPADQVTDYPERFIVAELIREKVLQLTREEIPHSVAVNVEQMQHKEENDVLYISANIFTERTSQKAILIGKNGDMLKRVGSLARYDIERLLGSKSFLELWVKVKKDWRNQEHMLRSFGFHE